MGLSRALPLLLVLTGCACDPEPEHIDVHISSLYTPEEVAKIEGAIATWTGLTCADISLTFSVEFSPRGQWVVEPEILRPYLAGFTTWNVGTSSAHVATAVDLTPSQFWPTILHETGHAFGLPHDDVNNVMQPGLWHLGVQQPTRPSPHDLYEFCLRHRCRC